VVAKSIGSSNSTTWCATFDAYIRICWCLLRHGATSKFPALQSRRREVMPKRPQSKREARRIEATNRGKHSEDSNSNRSIRRRHHSRETQIGLGLNRSVASDLPDTLTTRGMIMKVQHLVRVVEGKRKAARNSTNFLPATARARTASASSRGIGSGKGETAAAAAQTASGVRIKGFEGGRWHRRLPKRGFKNVPRCGSRNQFGKVQAAIDAGRLDPNAVIDGAALVKAGLMRRVMTVRLLVAANSRPRSALRCTGASKSAVAAVAGPAGPSKSWRRSGKRLKKLRNLRFRAGNARVNRSLETTIYDGRAPHRDHTRLCVTRGGPLFG
jgi:large subunit ribosomal protein L15